MGLRCDSCNKFAAYDTDVEPEIDGEDVSVEGVVTCNVRICNQCADCGQEMTEATFDFELDLSDEIDAHRQKNKKCRNAELEVEIETERTDSGSGRYAKRMYGVDLTAKVKCGECGEEFTATAHDEIAASYMESLV